MKTPEDFNTDPLDALLADALQDGSATLPDDGFTVRVSTEIRLRNRRQRWLRAVPWVLGLLATALTFIFRPQSWKIPQFPVDMPNPTTFAIPTWMEKANAVLSSVNAAQPAMLVEFALAAIVAVVVFAAVRRQPDFRW